MKRSKLVKWLLISVVAVAYVAACQVCHAEETNGANGWAVTAVGNDDLLSLRVGTRPWGERTELGLFGVWHDGLAAGERESWGGGAYATYDVVSDAPFTLAALQIPVTWYIGAQLGALDRRDSSASATAALMAGISFGGERVRIIIEYTRLLDEGLWNQLGVIDEKDVLALAVSYRFR